MRYFKFLTFLFATLFMMSCQEDDLALDTILVPTDLTVDTNISEDGSGLVDFTATANNAITYKYVFSDGSTAVAPGGDYTKRFTRTGLNTYLVTVIAYGKGGVSSSKSIEVDVESDFNDPDTKQFLTGGNSKTWYVAAFQAGHLGVGPSSGDNFANPSYYAAAPFEKAGDEISSCFYTDEITFSENGENISYNQDNNGQTFFNVDFVTEFGGGGGQDECIAYDTSGDKSVTLAPASSGIPAPLSTGTEIQISGGGFMSYYIGASNYEVLSISENSLYVRAIPSSNPELAWYLKFTTTPFAQQEAGGDTGEEEGDAEPFVSQFDEILWSDEFDGETLDTDNWNYEIGNGTDGWGNGEVQYYTEDNVTVANGNLIITARREAESGYDFTSGRITTQDKFEFTYGRVEARAKMPAGGGTWPAIWMLGANFDEVGWPQTGEIDIMEWVGNNPTETSSALHFPGNSGGNAVVGRTSISNATTEFHTYSVEWTADNITLLLDGIEFFTFTNEASLPFNKDFFLIMNVAMGGGLGGEIDPAFQESSLEVDYIRVYQ